MKVKVFLLSSLAISCLSACVQKNPLVAHGHWVDLTHPFSESTIYWPNAEHFKLEKVFDGATSGGYHYSANRYSAAEHGGTHMDAPIHFSGTGETVDKITIEQTVGPAVIIDVMQKVTSDRDYQVTSDDFLAFENRHGQMPPGAIVLIRTGYDRYWPDAQKYLGTSERGEAAIPKLHFPGLAPEGARWLVEKRQIRAVGLDTASIDYGQSRLFESHRVLAQNKVPIFENLMDLERLPETGSTIVALPMKIQDGSGAPLRAVGFIAD